MIIRKEFLKRTGFLVGVAFIPEFGFAGSKRPVLVDEFNPYSWSIFEYCL